MKKTIYLLLMLFMFCNIKAQITFSMSIPDPIPEYNGSYEDCGQNHFFYPNDGEIRYADEYKNSTVEEVRYYTKFAWPQQYLLANNNISMVFSKRHGSGASAIDSLHRVDIEMDNSSSSAFLAHVDTQNTAVLNYFTEWFSSSCRTDVKGGASIACQSIWPNIDMVIPAILPV